MARKKKKKEGREYEHLAYFEILSGGYKMTENQDSFCMVSFETSIPRNLNLNENG